MSLNLVRADEDMYLEIGDKKVMFLVDKSHYAARVRCVGYKSAAFETPWLERDFHDYCYTLYSGDCRSAYLAFYTECKYLLSVYGVQ